jgi:hypothetical protein
MSKEDAISSAGMESKCGLAEQQLSAVAGGELSLYKRAATGLLYGALGAAGGPGTCYGDYGTPHPCHPTLFPYG